MPLPRKSVPANGSSSKKTKTANTRPNCKRRTDRRGQLGFRYCRWQPFRFDEPSKVPSRIVANFISIFSYSVDFRRDIKKGDRFEIIYQNYITPGGEVVKNGNILYASLTLGKNKISLYRFKDAAGNSDYYDAKGFAMKKNAQPQTDVLSKRTHFFPVRTPPPSDLQRLPGSLGR